MEAEILKASQDWAKAIESRNPGNVIGMYHADAVLWGTLAKEARHGHEKIEGYFIKFLQRESIQCEYKDNIVRIYEDFAFHSGSYEFSWKVADKKIIVPARFSFVYKKENNRWLILEHHSSLFPDQQFKMKNFVMPDLI